MLLFGQLGGFLFLAVEVLGADRELFAEGFLLLLESGEELFALSLELLFLEDWQRGWDGCVFALGVKGLGGRRGSFGFADW